ncbi:MAG: isocitrate/isopropylmalate family dehydrogenase [Gammaproteobacteria bacterium]|nr:isocitrate/isopropylmalate family dehydrogenase [Gammaproteobacteria bacterium]MDH3468360.1 isocitrate/isopropylmalate family dehydrogenase [Gammaproteobacteria bacterium]
MPGDGIGPEVTAACIDLLDIVESHTEGLRLEYETLEAGAGLYTRTGEALPAATLEKASGADAILLGAMGLPQIRAIDGREITPQLDIREAFQLYAGVRPIRTFPGLKLPLADGRAKDLDVVLIRESTEGLFAGRNNSSIENDDRAFGTMEITRSASERLFDFAFNLARSRNKNGRPGRVTCVDKANVLQPFYFFRQIFDERAARFPDIAADHCYVDAMALNLVRQPWDYDVLVTENLFGDILSDLGAGLMGGMGMAPSADIGDEHAVFQPCHGSAPDIAGSGKANPTAMALSAAMMLDWLGERHGNAAAIRAGQRLRGAIEQAFAAGNLLPFELDGTDGTAQISAAIHRALIPN